MDYPAYFGMLLLIGNPFPPGRIRSIFQEYQFSLLEPSFYGLRYITQFQINNVVSFLLIDKVVIEGNIVCFIEFMRAK